MTYIFFSFFLFSINFISRKHTQEKYLFYYIFLFLLFFFSAFRYEVGCDWTGYEYYFEKIKSIDWITGILSRDPLWFIITKFFGNLDFSYLSLNIISSLIFFIGIHALARKQPNPLGFLVLVFPILIINMPMSAIRQAAAIGFFCIALVHFIEKRRFFFIFWIILGSFMHYSAIVMILLFPFISGSYNLKNILLIIFAIIFVLGATLISETGQQALRVYIGTIHDSKGAIFRTLLLMLSGLYFLLFAKKKWKLTFPEDYNLVNNGSILMILLLFLTPISSVIADRFSYYLIPIQAMIFARLSYLPFRSNHLLQSLIPYISYFFVFFVWTLFSWHFKECYVPYNNWLFSFLEY